MKIYTRVLIVIFILVLIFKSVSSFTRRMSVCVKSVSFNHSDDSLIKLGNEKIPIPETGDGIYALALNRTMYGTSHRIMYIGVLKLSTYEYQLKKMDYFFNDSIHDGFSHISIFSIGTTHEKPILEILRTGISFGEIEDILDIFRRHEIKRFTSFSHGVRKPYVFIKNVTNGKTIERTGSTGGKIIANL